MSIIFVLIPIAILLVIVAIGIFFWAVRSDQFNNLDKQAHSILFEDDKEQHKKSNDN
ncbi:cbb3-type cytochrome oxidase assembly protein CcoS [Pseudoalteromonas sp.]|uniref:cbb3-type cytochrome oxidase assembly protein CcoS n=1 Tax=Pseudoalteromonas sp. TaxID=53249 RepID=UPI00356AD61B